MRRWEALGLAAGLTIAALAWPSCQLTTFVWYDVLQPVPQLYLKGGEWSVVPVEKRWWHMPAWVTYPRYADTLLLLLGLVLTLPCPKESGLRLGNVRDHWRKLLLLIGGPLLLTAIVYPQLSVRPFADADLSIWLISPLAQDLVFGGTIYRILRPHFSGYIHPKLPMEWVLPVGGLFFAAWHMQNFTHMPAGYVCFQLLYTWAAFTFVGLSRQWTGSLLYVTFAHMAGNFLVWYVK